MGRSGLGGRRRSGLGGRRRRLIDCQENQGEKWTGR